METLVRQLRDALALAKLVGAAPSFLKAIGPLPAVAKSGAIVLICGETGTGKELVARAIHYLSEQAAFPFIPVNCGSYLDTLLEEAFFGHERGAFTDAHLRNAGLLAQAEGGTLFLDEVATLSTTAQVTLLRVLQEKKYRVIGSSHEHEIHVRFIAATNARLDPLMQAGAFRTDLYYRLSVFQIHLPPLRDRQEDILPLAYCFLEKHAPVDRAPLELTPSACAALVSYRWPGNVRELENAIMRGIYLSQTRSIEVEDLGLSLITENRPDADLINAPSLDSFKVAKQKTTKAFERNYLIRLLCEHRGNVSHAARTAGKERSELSKLLKKYGLDPKFFQSPGTPS